MANSIVDNFWMERKTLDSTDTTEKGETTKDRVRGEPKDEGNFFWYSHGSVRRYGDRGWERDQRKGLCGDGGQTSEERSPPEKEDWGKSGDEKEAVLRQVRQE